MSHHHLDEALEGLRNTGTEVAGGGDPNHGPMVVEALATLGHDALAPAWAERYRRRLGTVPSATSPVTMATWREALGHEDRRPDWMVFFARQLAESSWETVLRVWLERLVPAIVTAGRHGLIRTAHIVRALSERSTDLRVEELGVALAYWASHYRELAGVPQWKGPLDFPTAIERVPRIMRGQERKGMPRKFIYEMSGKPELVAAIDAATEPDSIEHAIGIMTELGARTYLANRTRYPLIFVHSVTGPSALRLLLPHMRPETQRAALGFLWQSEAAVIAAYGEDTDDSTSALDDLVGSWTDVVERSIETDDPHAIKMVEASFREAQHRTSPLYLAAASDWTRRVSASTAWSHAERCAAGIEMGR